MAPPLKLTMDQPAEYQITAEGRLDPERGEWFNGMTVEVRRAGGVAVTVLRGSVRDQADLHGMLRTLYTLGMPLLAVRLARLQAPDIIDCES